MESSVKFNFKFELIEGEVFLILLDDASQPIHRFHVPRHDAVPLYQGFCEVLRQQLLSLARGHDISAELSIH